MSIVGIERDGPDDRESLRVHRCDVCGKEARTPLIVHAANPNGWFCLELSVGRHGTVFFHRDVCQECWLLPAARQAAIDHLWKETQ